MITQEKHYKHTWVYICGCMYVCIPLKINTKDCQEWSREGSNKVKKFLCKKKTAWLKFPPRLLTPSYFILFLRFF